MKLSRIVWGIYVLNLRARHCLLTKIFTSNRGMFVGVMNTSYKYISRRNCALVYHNICTLIKFSVFNLSQVPNNKANLRNLIAATGLVILLKLDSNHRFFSPCDFEIWWMTTKNNPAPLLCYFKLFASFRSHWWIQTGVTVRKHPIWVKINDFF